MIPHLPTSPLLPKLRRKLHVRIARALAHITGFTVAGVLLLVVALGLAVTWYMGSADFERRATEEVVKTLEQATGGRVELQHIHVGLWRLAVEADGLVIHGLEGPGEVPYLAADRILVRVKLNNIVEHLFGRGSGQPIGLSLLRVEKPTFHLIVDKDGKTNQPTPPHHADSKTPVMDTLLDLQAAEVEVVDGVALFNDRAIPFHLAARGLAAQVRYLSQTRAAPEHYAAVVDLSDLRTQMLAEPQAESHLHIEAEVGRDTAKLTQFSLHTGAASDLSATASLTHFAQPAWTMQASGKLELNQIRILTGAEGLVEGNMELELAGRSCNPTAAPAAGPSSFWRQRRPKTARAAQPSDPECPTGFLVTGNARLHRAAYVNEFVRFHEINGGGRIRITPREMLYSSLTASLPGGGSASGDMKILNWMGGATPSTTSIDAQVERIPLRTIMDTTAVKGYGDLGFDTAASGPVQVNWGGPDRNVNDTVQVEADLHLAPTGVPRRTALTNVPVTGEMVGHYDGRHQVVELSKVDLHSPQSTLTGGGRLGVALGDRLTALQLDMTVHDFGEFDQLLHTLQLEGAYGTKGTAAIPAILHGSAVFHGTATGEMAKLDVKGHLVVNNFEFRLEVPATPPPAPVQKPAHLLAALLHKDAPPPAPVSPPHVTDVLIDSLVADGEYTPFGLAVANSTIQRGSAVLNVTGTFQPRTVVHHGRPDYLWDQDSTVDMQAQLANASVVDLLEIAGQQQKLPLTGTINVNAHAAGVLKTLSGAGTIQLQKGVAWGEPFEAATVALVVNGRQIEASSIELAAHGMKLTGNGGYNLDSKHLNAHLAGSGLHLARFVTVQQVLPQEDGVLTLVADADGTIERPGLRVHLQLDNFTYDGGALGAATLDAKSEGDVVSYTLTSNLAGAQWSGSGETHINGDFQTQAKLSLAGLDIAKPLALLRPGGPKASSIIAGSLTLSGPARRPEAMLGTAQFERFEATSQNITLKAAEPLRFTLRDGLAHLDQVHITGTDTDLRGSGTIQLFAADPKLASKLPAEGGNLDLKAQGSVSMALAHAFDPSLIASGKIDFSVGAGGTVANPSLSGKVQVQKVNIAIDGIPNGLSNMDGTMVFNEDRLNVENLVATTGGGQLHLGGFLTYRNGLYADMTATGESVRIRYLGLSSTANANLRLQGAMETARLSGNILITRFGVGADVDFAAFSAAGGVSDVADPSAISNNIQLDVHITSSPQLDFQNSYAKLAGTVDLTMRGTIAEPTVLGRIQITDGSATFNGTKYELQRGDIYFSNPVRIDPTIDLDATARVENYDLTVGLHGTATHLKPTYRSEPPLSEPDILNLLALGRTQEETQINQEQQLQQGNDPTTSALLGGALNSTVGNRVSRLFGVSSVKIDPAFVGTLGNSSARITVQQQISRQLTLIYATNINYSSQQLISVQYQLNPNMALVATRDESGVFSVVYKIRQRYR